ncbi:MAG TPA: IS701 family transposase, partial [Anaerolineales bacterium]
ARSKRRQVVDPPASGRPPSPWLLPEAVEASAEALIAFHGLFEDCFSRREQRQWSLFYLCGQLSNLERKTIEPMVLALHGADPKAVRAAQRFITEGQWNAARMRQCQQGLIAAELGEADGVVIADGSGFPKQGEHSVGVAYQYCGHLGKVANCQQGVFLVYVSSRGYAFLDERLYVPECWFTQAYRERRKACRLPADLPFQTEPELALAMLSDLQQQALVPFRWVTADETYGKSPGFLDGIAALDKWYLVEVPQDTRVWLRTPAVEPPGPGLLGRPRTRLRVAHSAPAPREVRELAQSLPKSQWTRRVIKEGSKGPLVAEFAFLRATTIRSRLPGPRVWVVFRRSLGPVPELKVYFSNAPTTCPPSEFIRMSGLRWPVETTLEEGKGEVGLDHFETRTWPSWHHHMAQTFLAHLFLIRLRRQWQKKPLTHYGASSPAHRSGYRRSSVSVTQCVEHLALPPVPQSCRLPLTPQAHPEAASLAL